MAAFPGPRLILTLFNGAGKHAQQPVVFMPPLELLKALQILGFGNISTTNKFTMKFAQQPYGGLIPRIEHRSAVSGTEPKHESSGPPDNDNSNNDSCSHSGRLPNNNVES